MRLGKLDNDKLNALVLSKLSSRRPEVRANPGVGLDCAAVDFLPGGLAVFSMDPITSATKNLARLSVHVSCNDAAAAGAEPIGLLVTLLLPPSITELEIDQFSDELEAAALEANVDIIGGHTEVTDAVTRVVTCTAVVAKAGPNGFLSPRGMQDGDEIVMTKAVALEGTGIIASDFDVDFLTEPEWREAVRFLEELSVVREGIYAAEHGATAMHDATEGGILGALWELSEASGRGILVDRDAVILRPVTKKLCDHFMIDPLRLVSSGCMLIACPDGRAMVNGLKTLGVSSAVIGSVGGTGVRLTDGTAVAPPQADEIYRLFSQNS